MGWHTKKPNIGDQAQRTGEVGLAACYVQLGRMTEAQEAVANYEREKPADADFPRYAAAHCRLCLRQEDADHWMEGYRKAGLIE